MIVEEDGPEILYVNSDSDDEVQVVDEVVKHHQINHQAEGNSQKYRILAFFRTKSSV